MISAIRRFVLLALFPAVIAAGCGGATKTTTKTQDAPKHKSSSGAQTGDYHAGERCRQSLSLAYSAQGFTCVNGKLRHKARQAPPPTVHHHNSHTTTAAPQGY